jgi:hypothetical protein
LISLKKPAGRFVAYRNLIRPHYLRHKPALHLPALRALDARRTP